MKKVKSSLPDKTCLTSNLSIILFVFLVSCVKEDTSNSGDVLIVPAGFPVPNIPADNSISQDRVTLGKMLFYDPILSRDSSLSCATCHKSELAFTDGLAKSSGIDGQFTMRNSPTLANVAYNPYFLSEGGVPTLEQQILVPIQEHVEFDNNILIVAEALNRRQDIVDLAQKAYGRIPDPFVITRSIAAFERTIMSGESSYDQYLTGINKNALSDAQTRGKNLFFSEKLNCSQCHSGFTFTNYTFQNNGLYKVYADPGRKRLTGKSEDEAMFKVPTLRNIELTGPYMHDGSLKSLEDVVEHYNSGGEIHFNKSKLIKPLNLTKSQKIDLVEFLKSLTDFGLIKDKRFKK